MPRVRVVLHCEASGVVPFLAWFRSLPSGVQDKCRVRIERLAEQGHLLRRPEADYLRDGIHELRARHKSVRYRILYFFHGRETAVISHGFSKPGAKVPDIEVRRAVVRSRAYRMKPEAHTHEER